MLATQLFSSWMLRLPIVGYGFGDAHINKILADGARAGVADDLRVLRIYHGAREPL